MNTYRVSYTVSWNRSCRTLTETVTARDPASALKKVIAWRERLGDLIIETHCERIAP